MKDFCKLFKSEKYGQILVIADINEEGHPSVMVKLVPEGMGICGPTYAFTDSDEDAAWDKVDKVFESFNLEKAESVAKDLSEICQGIIN